MKKFTIFLLTFLLFVGFINVNAQNQRNESNSGPMRTATHIEVNSVSALYCKPEPVGNVQVFFQVTGGSADPLSNPKVYVSDTSDAIFPDEWDEVPSTYVFASYPYVQFSFNGPIDTTTYFMATIEQTTGMPGYPNYHRDTLKTLEPYRVDVIPEPPLLFFDPEELIGIICEGADVTVEAWAEWELAPDEALFQYFASIWHDDGSGSGFVFVDLEYGPTALGKENAIPIQNPNLTAGDHRYLFDFFVMDKNGQVALGCNVVDTMEFTVVEPPVVEIGTLEVVCEDETDIRIDVYSDFVNTEWDYTVKYELFINETSAGTILIDIDHTAPDPIDTVFKINASSLDKGTNGECYADNNVKVTIAILNTNPNTNVDESTCIGEDEAIIRVYNRPDPAQILTTDLIHCDDPNFVLEAEEPVCGVGVWTILTEFPPTAPFAEIDEPSNHITDFTLMAGYAAELKWEVTNDYCTVLDEDRDTITLYNYMLPTVDLGSDIDICGDGEEYQIIPVTVAPGGLVDPAYEGDLYYSWTFEGTITGEVDPTDTTIFILFTDGAATGKVYLTVSDDNGCSYTDTVEVNIDELVLAVAGPDTLVCASSRLNPNAPAPITTVTLQGNDPYDIPEAPNATGLWTVVDDFGYTITFDDATDPNATATFTGVGTQEFEFVWTITNGQCEDADIVKILLREPPVVEIMNWDVCAQTGFDIAAEVFYPTDPSLDGSPYIFTWEVTDLVLGDGAQLIDTTSLPYSILPINTDEPATGNAKVTVRDQWGCTATDEHVINIWELPIVTLEDWYGSCIEEAPVMTITATTTNGLPPYSYIWMLGPGVVGTYSDENFYWDPQYPVESYLMVIVADDHGCVNDYTTHLSVINPYMQIDIDDIPSPLCNYSTINLGATVVPIATNTTLVYDWWIATYDDDYVRIDEKTIGLNELTGEYSLDLGDDVAYIKFCLQVHHENYPNDCDQIGCTGFIKINKSIRVEGSGIDTICHGGSVKLVYDISNFDLDLMNYPVYYRWLENELFLEGAYELHMLQAGQTQVSFTTYPALHNSEEGPASYCYQLEIWQGDFSAATNPLDPQFCHTFSQCHMVTVLKDPVATISGPITVYRKTASVEFTANVVGGYGEPTYTWYLNGELQDQTDKVFILDDQDVLGNDGHYDIAVKVKQSYPGCEADLVIHYFDVVCATGNVTIVGPEAGCIGQSITLTAVIVTDVTDYTIKWKKDGQYLDDETGLTYTFTVEEPIDITEFQVEVSFCGCEVTIAPAHYFQVLPNTVAWVDNYIMCANGAVEVEVNHANWDGQIYRYLWYDDAAALEPFEITYVNHRLFTFGELTGDVSTFYVQVEMLNAACTSNWADFTITLQGSLEPVVIVPATLITCVATPVYFSLGSDPNSQLYGIPTVSWWVDGIEIPGQELNYINIPFFTVGTHYVYAHLVYPGNNCEYLTNQVAIQVREIIDVTIDGPSVVCPSQIATLYAIVDPIDPEYTYTYQWYLNGAIMTGETDASLLITENPSPVPYIYMVKVTDPQSGCVKQSEPFAVEVVEFPVIAIAADKTKICIGEEVVIVANVTHDPNMKYQWYEGQTPLTGENAPILYIIPNNTATYTFTATQIGSGCVATSNAITITVVEIPEIQIAISVSNICEGAPVVLEATPKYAGVYTWYENGTIIQGAVTNKIIVFPKTQEGLITNYYYTAIVTVDPGCASEISNEVTVEVNPALDIFIDGNDIFCDNTNVVLYGNVLNYNQLTGPLNYTWIIAGIEGIPVDTEPYLDGFAEGYYVQFDNLLADGFEAEFSATHPVLSYTGNNYGTGTPATCSGGSSLFFMYELGSNDATSSGIADGTLAAQTAAADFIQSITDAILEQAQLDALADAQIANPYISFPEGMAKGYAYANAMVTELFKASIINAVPGYDFASLNTPDPVSGTYTPAYWGLPGFPCLTGVPQQLFAYSVGYMYGYWLAYGAEFADVYYLEILNGITELYTNEYAKIFDENYDMIIDVVTSGSFDPAVAGNQIVFDQLLPARNYPYRVYLTVTGENGCITTSEPFYVTVVSAPEVEITANYDAVCPGTEIILTAHVIEQNPDPLQYQFRWYAEDINNPIEGEIYPTLTVLPDAVGDYLYIVRVYHIDSECETFAQFNVSVQSLELDIEVIADTICKGEQVTFQVLDGQPDAVYTWYIGGVEVVGANLEIFTHKFNEAGIFVVEVSATSQALGCISERLLAGTITVKDAPSVEIYGTHLVCNAEIPTYLTAIVDPSNATVTYQWYVTHNEIKTELGTNAVQQIINIPSPYQYIYVVEITDIESGCVVLSDAFMVTVEQFATVAITASTTEICPAELVVLSADVPAENNMIYQWYIVDEDGELIKIEGADAPVYYVYPEETTTYTFTVTQIESECVSTSNTITVTVIPVPIIETVPVVETICQGDQITFETTILTPDPVIYKWFISGLEIVGADLPSLTYKFNLPGIFDVKVYATTIVAGCTSEMIYAGTITVKAAPTVSIEGPTIVCPALDPTILYAVVDPTTATVTYQWYENVLEKGTAATQIVNNEPSPYPYIYTVEITDYESGCLVKSLAHTVYVQEEPNIPISADITEICAGETVLLTANISPSNNMEYQWYADNVAIQGANSPQLYVFPTQTTVYTFTATELVSNCIYPSNEITVTVIPKPFVTIVPIVSTICEGEQVTFAANLVTLDPVFYTWFINGFAVPGEYLSTFTPIFDHFGTFVVTVIATTQVAGCISEIVYAGTITVKAPPTVSISGPNAVCNSTIPMYLHADITPLDAPVTYQWSVNHNGNNTVLGTEPVQQILNIPHALPYFYKVVIVDIESGCEVVSEVHQVMVSAYSNIIIEADQTEVCAGTSITITADIEEYINWIFQWYYGEIPIEGETDLVLVVSPFPGSHSYSFVATQLGSECTANSNVVNILVKPIPEPPVLTISDNTICSGDPVTITGDVIGIYEWWKNGDLVAIGADKTFTDQPTANNILTTYTYKATVTVNGCTSDFFSVVPVSVVVHPAISVTIFGANDVCEQALEGEHLALHAIVTGLQPGVSYHYRWLYRQGNAPYVEFYADNDNNYAVVPNNWPVNDLAAPYCIIVEVTANEYDCTTASDCHEVNIWAKPTVTIGVDYENICLTGTIMATAYPTPAPTPENPYNYIWTVNGVPQVQNAPVIYITNNLQIGVNEIAVTIERAYASLSCFGSASKNVNVLTPPSLALTQDIEGLQLPGMCTGGQLNLFAEVVDFDETLVDPAQFIFEWRRNGNPIGSGLQYDYYSEKLNVAGTYNYEVKAYINNSLGCNAAWTAFDPVKVVTHPTVSIYPKDYTHSEVCVGAVIEIHNVLGMPEPTIQMGYQYKWNDSSEWINFTNQIDPRTVEFNTTGQRTFFLDVTFANPTCNDYTSEKLIYKVVADPDWVEIDIQPSLYDGLCLGETVTLHAAFQGGVSDGTNFGKIQWMYQFNDENYVNIPGVGGDKIHKPAQDGDYYYVAKYIPFHELSGCNIDPEVLGPMVVSPTITPAAWFVANITGEKLQTCVADPLGKPVVLTIEFYGTPPFDFTIIENPGTGIPRNYTSHNHIYQLEVAPTVTTTYTLASLSEKTHCVSGEFSKSDITIVVTDIEIINPYVEVCGSTVDLTIKMISYLKPEATITFSCATPFTVPIIPTGTYSTLSIPIPNCIGVGIHDLIVSVDGCDYNVTIMKNYEDGTDGNNQLIYRRWEGNAEVLVVSNNYMNPESQYFNGGYQFTSYQWYKNGVLIPGATKQYYQDPEGVNGVYSIRLTGTKASDGTTFEFYTCDQSFNPSLTLKVFPVPAQVDEPVWVEVDLTPEELEGATLEVYDAKGALVKQIKVVGRITEVTGFKAQGAYYGKITTGTNEIKSVRFLIVK